MKNNRKETKETKEQKYVRGEKEKFLQYVRAMIEASSKHSDPKLIARLTAFSILVAIDGEAASLGPYALKPLNEEGKEGKDIGGDLHNSL